MSKEPRFVNQTEQPVYVTFPGTHHQRCVRPFRELGVIQGRKDEDCICVGAHYAQFPGLLAPFPEPAVKPDAPTPAPTSAAPPTRPTGDPTGGLGIQAGNGRFQGTGEVRDASGKLKQDAPAVPAVASGEAAATTTADEDDEPENLGKDVGEDRPLEDIPGMTPKLAADLRANGYATALAIANCQSKKKVTALGKVVGKDNAQPLVDTVHKLLDWTDED